MIALLAIPHQDIARRGATGKTSAAIHCALCEEEQLIGRVQEGFLTSRQEVRGVLGSAIDGKLVDS